MIRNFARCIEKREAINEYNTWRESKKNRSVRLIHICAAYSKHAFWAHKNFDDFGFFFDLLLSLLYACCVCEAYMQRIKYWFALRCGSQAFIYPASFSSLSLAVNAIGCHTSIYFFRIRPAEPHKRVQTKKCVIFAVQRFNLLHR